MDCLSVKTTQVVTRKSQGTQEVNREHETTTPQVNKTKQRRGVSDKNVKKSGDKKTAKDATTTITT